MAHCRRGDRIMVLDMPNDPDPIPQGETGTVDHVANEGSPLEQIYVRWDSGRSLILLPTDGYRVIGHDDNHISPYDEIPDGT